MRLVHLFIFFPILALPLSACKFFPDDPLPDRVEVRPPPVVEVPEQEGKFYYTPPALPGVNTDAPVTAKVCDLEQINHETDPDDVKGRKIDFVQDTITITEELEPQDQAQDADYLHLTDIDIIRTAGAALEYIEWVRIWIAPEGGDPTEVAWGTFEGNGNEIDLRVDGSVDLSDHLADGVTLKGEVRASAPSSTSWIKARLTLLKFSNCE